MVALSAFLSVNAQITDYPVADLPLKLVFPTPAEGNKGWYTIPVAPAPLAGKVTITESENSLTLDANGWPQYQAINYTLNDGVETQVIVNLSKGGYIAALASATTPAKLRFDFLSNVGNSTVSDSNYRSANVNSAGIALKTEPTWIMYPVQKTWMQSYSKDGKFDPEKDGHVDSTRISHLNINVERVLQPALGNTGVEKIDSFIINDQPLSVVAGLESALEGTTKIYPNPAIGNAFVDYTLKSGANVKFAINDMNGRTIALTTEQFRNAGFSHEILPVNNLEQGVYNVTYIVDGVAARAERLIVK